MSKFIKNFYINLGMTLINIFLIILLQSNFDLIKLLDIVVVSNRKLVVSGLIIISLYIFLFCITRKKILSWTITSFSLIIISLISWLKVKYIGIPLLLSDLNNIKNTNIIFGYLTFGHKIIFIFILAIMACAIMWVIKVENSLTYYKSTHLTRVLVLVFLVVVYGVLMQGKGNNNNYYLLTQNLDFDSYLVEPKTYYERNGFLSGLFSIQGVEGVKSVSYTTEHTNYLTNAKSSIINKSNEIVIYILAESFFDPKRMKSIQLNKDPIPYIRSIMEEYTSGKIQLTKNTFGTSLSEYEAITSFAYNFYNNFLSPYDSYLPLLREHPFVGDLFDNQIAIHTYSAELYNRKKIYPDVYKFQRFKYDGSDTDDLLFKYHIDNHEYISDESGFKEVLEEIKQVPKDESGFIFYLTMQNHSPYKKDFYKELNFDVSTTSGTELSESDKMLLQVYLEGLHYSDLAIQNFIEEVNKINRPITIVFFGDHKPVISSVIDDEEGRKTDYFIFQNYKVEKLNYPLISTNYLSTVMLKLTSVPKSPFYNFMDQLFEAAPVLYEDSIFKKDEQQFISKNEDKEIEELLFYYDVIHSDVLTEKKLLGTQFFMNNLK